VDKDELNQIVAKVQNDMDQFELLYTAIEGKIYYWCCNVIGNESEAKDAAQEAMIRIYNKLNTLTTPETFESWIYILVRNVCYAYLRKNKRNDKLLLDFHAYEGKSENNIREKRVEVLPKEAYELKVKKTFIQNRIQELPKKQKIVITLYYLDELKIHEIAEKLDCSIGTIKSRLHDGRKSLEKSISKFNL